MELRTKLGAAALLAAAAMATAAGCGGRDDDNPTPTPDAGCTGVCSTDAGSDAGTNTDAGSDAGTGDAGPTANQIAATRKVSFGTKATLRDVVVSGIHYEKLSDQGNGSWRSYFWVTDPAAPKEGLFIHKFYTDTPDAYHPQLGDTVDIVGYFGTEPNNSPFTGRRHHLANQQTPAVPLAITPKLTDAGTANLPPANEVTVDELTASLAAAQNSAAYLGTRVHLAGPLTLTNPQPSQLQRLDNEDAGTLFYGFEVTGGILVYHDKTRDRSDGGLGCDYQKAALDGGSVTFPNGITGVWDTYTFAGCINGSSNITSCGTGGNDRDSGVPGTDQRYTYTIIPQGCEDLPGEVVVPE
ncbi:hypothetical protein HJC10_35535 [Corallococcus exiguus]|uniref:hypothetical protein n=1 Tax=Corallococcus TaxID=83461 RepID=UPI000EDAD37E|nr:MULTISPECIES: hypothetical protein [Corallococcus]NNB99880.1 hypothetical protein [Corallococcus exiguus]NNC08138.1 hypothetical protein [Corallococcus exiguus]NPC51944.1 hypothetical protein [Corallococcus exiguus]RKH77428.1 hypothetical protein D7X99_31535 [Corallococcus sp. AB032C]